MSPLPFWQQCVHHRTLLSRLHAFSLPSFSPF